MSAARKDRPWGIEPGKGAPRKSVRNAVVRVAALTVACPHCEELLAADESVNHNEAVFAPPGHVTCANCKEPFMVPDLSTLFRRLFPHGGVLR